MATSMRGVQARSLTLDAHQDAGKVPEKRLFSSCSSPNRETSLYVGWTVAHQQAAEVGACTGQ